MINGVNKWTANLFKSGETMRWAEPAVILLLIFVPLGMAGVLSYRTIERDQTEAVLARREAISYLAAAGVAARLDRLTDIGVALATRVRFSELVNAGEWDEAIKILTRVPSDFPFVDRVFLTDPGGTLMADTPEFPGVRGKNFAFRDWYQGVSRNWKPYVSNVYKRAAEPRLNVFAVAVPIKSKNLQITGILLLQVRLDALFEWIKGVEMGSSGFVYVVDRKGQIAYHPKFPPQGNIADFSSVPVVQDALRGDRGVKITFNPIENEERISAYSPIAGYGWAVVSQQPTVSAFAAKNIQLRRFLTAYGLILVLCGLAVYLVLRTLAQRRQAEENRRQKAELERLVAERTAQLQAANKELESFSYSVSHDLRSPLRAIDGFSRILEEDYRGRLDEEGRRILKVIRDGSQKMGQLIDDLLAFSRLGQQSVSAAEIEMDSLAQEAFSELAPREKPAEFVVKPMPPAWGDRSLIRQVWVNLVGNGIKFTGHREKPVIEAGGYSNGSENCYYVKDNGAGFDMRYYDKLFGVFRRLHTTEEFPGTGVGLAIVQRIVTRHGGRVWAEGKLNEGATFYFALPLYRHASAVNF